MKAAESLDMKQDEENVKKELHLHTTPSVCTFSVVFWEYAGNRLIKYEKYRITLKRQNEESDFF